MMQQMRANTKWIMLITAVAFVGLMVFEWGMDMSGQSAGSLTGGRLGTVNGSAITYQEYTEVYRNLYQQAQEEQGGSISAAANRQIEDQAFEQLVIDRLIDQELKRRGVRVTEEEIRQAARFAPPPEFRSNAIFLTDGQFDLDKYHRFLASASDPQMLRDLEAYYRRVIPRNKLFQQVSAGVVVTDGELWRMYRERNETASMRFVPLDPAALIRDEEVTVQERAIAAYYNEHRDDFERPARATTRMVVIDKRPTAADTAAALAEARAVLAELQGGADFAEVAARVSEDPGSATMGGDLGTVRPGQMVPAFDEVVWEAPIGEVTGPVLTQFGYHLIQVDERSEETAEVAHILLPIERTLDSEDEMLARVDSLEAMVDRISLDAAAEAVGLQVREHELTPILPNLPGVGSVDEAVDWVFDQRPMIDEVSPVFENDRSYYVVELRDRQEARALTLEEAHESIETILRNEQKRERTREIGRDLVDRIEAGASLVAAAGALGLPVQTAGPFTRLNFVPGVGAGNAAIGAAFGLEVGEISGLLETREAFFVIEVTDQTPADREAWEAQLAQQRQQVIASLQNERINQFLEALREEADIRDDRDQVLQSAA